MTEETLTAERIAEYYATCIDCANYVNGVLADSSVNVIGNADYESRLRQLELLRSYDIWTSEDMSVIDPAIAAGLERLDADWSALEPDRLAEDVRSQRNALIAETDWWALSDNTMTQAQIDYRQALRDITDQDGFPTDVTWPEKP